MESPEGIVRNSLKALRVQAGMSQQQLCKLAGITRQTIGGIESGRYAPSASVALRLARALRAAVEDLFWLEDDLSELTTVSAASYKAKAGDRVSLVRVKETWVSHSLNGDRAFRTEMVPADGICLRGGMNAAVRALDRPANLARSVAIAGCAPVLSLWARSAERWHSGLRVLSIHANSTAALKSLARGEVHVAGIHLKDPVTGEDNAPYVKLELPKQRVALINLGSWEEGLIVPAGNPKKLRNASDLEREDVEFVNREAGAGSRLLLDSLLTEARVKPDQTHGYEREVSSHLEIATAVRDGRADTGLSTSSVAAAFGLGFVPLRCVRYDLAVLEEYMDEAPVRQLFSTLHHRWVRSQLEIMGGFDTSQTGEIVATV
jgi:putative molybdopterin biosynthesis protein